MKKKDQASVHHLSEEFIMRALVGGMVLACFLLLPHQGVHAKKWITLFRGRQMKWLEDQRYTIFRSRAWQMLQRNKQQSPRIKLCIQEVSFCFLLKGHHRYVYSIVECIMFIRNECRWPLQRMVLQRDLKNEGMKGFSATGFLLLPRMLLYFLLMNWNCFYFIIYMTVFNGLP